MSAPARRAILVDVQQPGARETERDKKVQARVTETKIKRRTGCRCSAKRPGEEGEEEACLGKKQTNLEGYWPNHLSVALSPARGCVCQARRRFAGGETALT